MEIYLYIKFDKNENKENIIISNINNKDEFDKYINIDDDLIPNNGKAVVKTDKLSNSLTLKNISDTNDKNIFVLQDIITLKPDENISYMNLGNIQKKKKMVIN